MQTITVCGGTLFDLASDYLGDATQWTLIASLNGITDPWLTGITTIVLPAPTMVQGGGGGAS